MDTRTIEKPTEIAAGIAWPQPNEAASLYSGTVMHARLKPVVHRFTYAVFCLLVDLDRLDEAGQSSRLFSVNRANIVSFHERDHIDGDAASLRVYADSLLQRAGIGSPADRILLACYPRVLGYVFNPISVYYAYDDAKRLLAMIYEVRNTFGERHTYVCPVEAGSVSAAGVRQERAKLFHVSPFIPMDMRYRFRMTPPAGTMCWRILETDGEGPLLSATFSAVHAPLTTATLGAALRRTPFVTWKIIAGIHWEAAKLWIKGARYISKPAAPAKTSFADAIPPARIGD